MAHFAKFISIKYEMISASRLDGEKGFQKWIVFKYQCLLL